MKERIKLSEDVELRFIPFSNTITLRDVVGAGIALDKFEAYNFIAHVIRHDCESLTDSYQNIPYVVCEWDEEREQVGGILWSYGVSNFIDALLGVSSKPEENPEAKPEVNCPDSVARIMDAFEKFKDAEEQRHNVVMNAIAEIQESLDEDD